MKWSYFLMLFSSKWNNQTSEVRSYESYHELGSDFWVLKFIESYQEGMTLLTHIKTRTSTNFLIVKFELNLHRTQEVYPEA